MIAREVGEQTSLELQTANAVLGNAMGTHLHKGIATTFIGHATKQTVQGDRVRSGMIRGNRFIIDVVAYSADQSAFIAEMTENVEEQGRNGCLSVGACNAD